MRYDDFEASLASAAPPDSLSIPLQALWHCARAGRDRAAWDAAHDLVNADPSEAASWVHAWLHRQEGDLPNAAYWYRRAGRPAARGDLQAEWSKILQELLGDDPLGTPRVE